MFILEAQTMHEMRHERVVEFIELDQEAMALIMELMPLGSLQGYMQKNRNMKWTDRYQMMLDITEGMAFLHAKTHPDGRPKRDVFHQDLKSGNVLLYMSHGKVRGKIGDFGLACEFPDNSSVARIRQRQRQHKSCSFQWRNKSISSARVISIYGGSKIYQKGGRICLRHHISGAALDAKAGWTL